MVSHLNGDLMKRVIYSADNGPVVLVAGTPESGEEVACQLRGGGFEVVVCRNPMRAFSVYDRKAIKKTPCLYLVDLVLPQMSGFVMARRLADHLAQKAIPVVLMSSCPSAEDRLEASLVGALAVLKKPLSVQDVVDVLEKDRMKKLRSEIGDLVLNIPMAGSGRFAAK